VLALHARNGIREAPSQGAVDLPIPSRCCDNERLQRDEVALLDLNLHFYSESDTQGGRDNDVARRASREAGLRLRTLGK
jgi:hypothetical protein